MVRRGVCVSGERLLLVDDDADIRDLLQAYFTRAGFGVATASDGETMWQALAQQPADLVVLDLMLPGDDGLALCRALRQRGSAVSIVMLTAQDTVTDRVVGLELGADDYLTKPFDPRELLARVRAVLRRTGARQADAAAAPEPGPEHLAFGPWKLDTRAHQVHSPQGMVMSLPTSDYRVLRALVERPNRTLSRDYLTEQAFGRGRHALERSVDVCISRLRQVLEDDARRPRLIRTVRHEGYMLQLAHAGH